jgi:hypothetical protein
MNFARRPPVLRKQTLFTTEEVKDVGCCLTAFTQVARDAPPQNDYRSCSAETRRKGINLVIAKRGQTQGKEKKHEGRVSPVKQPFSLTELKFLESVTGQSALTSKTATQKNSLRTSRTKLLNDTKPEQLTLANRYERYIDLCLDEKSRQMEMTFNHSKGENANGSIQMLSEISMVEEEFFSYESTTLRALNIASNRCEVKANEKGAATSRFDLATIPEKRAEDGKDARNPLQRLL